MKKVIFLTLMVILSSIAYADCFQKSESFDTGLWRMTCPSGYVAESCFSLIGYTAHTMEQFNLPERQCRVWLPKPSKAYVMCCSD